MLDVIFIFFRVRAEPAGFTSGQALMQTAQLRRVLLVLLPKGFPTAAIRPPEGRTLLFARPRRDAHRL